MADLRVENHGSIVLVTPETPVGQAWLDENVINDETQMWGVGSVVCEPRYVGDILAGAQRDGLTVKGV